MVDPSETKQVSLVTPTGRPIAPGGWRRAVVGLLVGAAVGAIAVATARSDRG